MVRRREIVAGLLTASATIAGCSSRSRSGTTGENASPTATEQSFDETLLDPSSTQLRREGDDPVVITSEESPRTWTDSHWSIDTESDREGIEFRVDSDVDEVTSLLNDTNYDSESVVVHQYVVPDDDITFELASVMWTELAGSPPDSYNMQFEYLTVSTDRQPSTTVEATFARIPQNVADLHSFGYLAT